MINVIHDWSWSYILFYSYSNLTTQVGFSTCQWHFCLLYFSLFIYFCFCFWVIKEYFLLKIVKNYKTFELLETVGDSRNRNSNLPINMFDWFDSSKTFPSVASGQVGVDENSKTTRKLTSWLARRTCYVNDWIKAHVANYTFWFDLTTLFSPFLFHFFFHPFSHVFMSILKYFLFGQFNLVYDIYFFKKRCESHLIVKMSSLVTFKRTNKRVELFSYSKKSIDQF